MLYTCLMGLGIIKINATFSLGYGSARMTNLFIYLEMFLAVIIVIIYFRSYRGMAFNKTIKSQVLGLGPWILILTTLVVGHHISINFEDFKLLLGLQVMMTALFMAISEELLFRGIYLFTLIKHRAPRLAFRLSALLYACFQCVYFLGGMPLKTVLLQIIMAYILGYSLATLAYHRKNISLLIALQFLWHLLVLYSQAFHTDLAYTLIGLQVLIVAYSLMVTRWSITTS